jgi:ubiquinone/menaquinone biosynthesis C-methylase UbiE
VTGPYAGMAEVWADDAALAYVPLARHLVALAPEPPAGLQALDAGAGSGAAGDALREAGARVVAADREFDMAAFGSRAGPAVTADVTALPFRAHSFDLVVAAFVVNHLARPAHGLAEMRRVARPRGAVLVSVFSTSRAAAKASVDEVAAAYGFVRPPWYDDLQRHASAVGSTESMKAALADAGFASVVVTEQAVDVGLTDPALVVRYRTGMPHLRRFVAGLAPERRDAFRREATLAVARSGEVFAPRVVEAVAVA